ncbi:hypothetical protein D3C78_1415820 [compost metagenome]
MAVDMHVEHLGEVSGAQLAGHHVPVGDGDAQAVHGGLDGQVQQVEFVAAAGVHALDAGGIQPVAPGLVAALLGGQHVEQGEVVEVGRFAALLQAGQQAGGADGDMPFVHQQGAVQLFPLAIAETDGAIQGAALGQAVLQPGGDAQLQLRVQFAQAAQAR